MFPKKNFKNLVMPELPEVETTVRGIKKILKGLKIVGVWTDYQSPHHLGKKNIKDKRFFNHFKKSILGEKIIDSSRVGKNVLIHLSNGLIILVHMKMSGHFLYGEYKKTKSGWRPKVESGPLNDPYNRFIRLVLTFSNGKHLAFSDLRRFAKITFFHEKDREDTPDLLLLGPEPLDLRFSFNKFLNRIYLKPRGKIKQVLMDQSVIAGIGNIYSDEILFEAQVHPEELVSNIPKKNLKKMYLAIKKILRYSIKLGGDSMSDFRNLEGKRGKFQNKHKAYKKTGEKCTVRGCRGTIERKKVLGRSAHFCNSHQQLLRAKGKLS